MTATINLVKKGTPELFGKIIGQESVKRKLKFFLDCYKETNTMENLLFQASQGYGKNMFSFELGRQLTIQNSNRIKQYVVINCSTIKNIAAFFDSVVNRYLRDSDVTCVLDEASEIPKDMQVALLSILDVNENPVNSFDYNNITYLFPKTRINWILLSTDSQSLIGPLLDRLEIVNFEEYNLTDITKIIERQLSYINIQDNILETVAKTLKGNARSAYMMAQKIKGYLERKRKRSFDENDWLDITNQLTILPLGLSQTELKILRIVSQNPNCSLTRLGAVLGLSSQCVRKFHETYLLKKGLLEIVPRGRCLSNAGREYLRSLNL